MIITDDMVERGAKAMAKFEAVELDDEHRGMARVALTASLEGSVAVPACKATAYSGPITVDAGLLHALWCYGILNPISGVVYSYGTHQRALDDADKLLFDRAKGVAITRQDRLPTTNQGE